MCGRFTQKYSWHDVYRLYGLTGPARNIQQRYNIAPTETVEVIINEGEGPRLVPMRWGLIPAWWKKSAKETPPSFNARAETAADKPFFRDSFHRRRCLVPASGFYEWRREGKAPPQPFYVSAKSGVPLTLAGLWDEWRDTKSGERIRSCTILIVPANALVGELHDRMPAILSDPDAERWLSGQAGLEVLKPAADDLLQVWPVSRRVNKSGADDDAGLIEVLAPG